MELSQLTARQRAFFESGATRPLAFREKALRDLRAAVLAREDDIAAALLADLHKHPSESYMCETGLVLDEIGYHLKHLSRWMRPQRVRTPLAQFPGQSLRVIGDFRPVEQYPRNALRQRSLQIPLTISKALIAVHDDRAFSVDAIGQDYLHSEVKGARAGAGMNPIHLGS